MPRPTFKEFKETLRQKDAKRYQWREKQGKLGELWAAEYLSLGTLPFLPLETSKFDKPEDLTIRGGKRTDFIVEVDNAVVLLDAKHHQTCNSTWFGLKEKEIAEFRIGQEYFQDILTELNDSRTLHTLMIVFPRELKGTRLVFIKLSELEAGTPYLVNEESWRGVDLTKLTERWDDHTPIAKPQD